MRHARPERQAANLQVGNSTVGLRTNQRYSDSIVRINLKRTLSSGSFGLADISR
jgi:hypothetical protein